MNGIKSVVFIVGGLFALITGLQAQPILRSPDQKLAFELSLTHRDTAGDAFQYDIKANYCFFRILKEGKQVMSYSPLGLTLAETDLYNEMRFVSNGEIKHFEETYEMIHGKNETVHSSFNACTYIFENPDGDKLQVEVRAYNEGVAFRYVLPNSANNSRKVLVERTGFSIDPKGRAWLTPYSKPTKWKPSYEMYYTNASPVGEPSPEGSGWSFPALFQVNEGENWILLHEAALDGNYPGTHLGNNCYKGVYRIAFPHPGEASGLYSALPEHEGSWEMPWRIVMVADELAPLVESNLIYDLNPSSKQEGDLSWIKPGRVSWEWWTTQTRDRDFKLQKEFIDLAVEMGWEYYLVDANWNDMKGGTIEELIKYANGKGIGLFLWYNSGGPHNYVGEQPRGRLTDHRVRKEEFERLKQWGIKGIKVDFFNSDKQEIIRQYIGILEDAGLYDLMVNFHGCTVPRGWERTYPNLLSMEAVKGAETYGFDPDFPQRAPEYNTIAAFSRAVVGSADATPVAFTSHNYPHVTTKGHELALALIYQSGLLHFADSPKVYLAQPEAVRSFLKRLPAQFEEVKLLGGRPGEYAAIARRKGDSWYVGVISAKKKPFNLKLDLALLGVKDGNILEISDSKGGLVANEKSLRNSTYSKEIAPYGGVVFVVQPN